MEPLDPYRPPQVESPERLAEDQTPEVSARRKALAFMGLIWTSVGITFVFLVVLGALIERRSVDEQIVFLCFAGFGALCAAAGVGLQKGAGWSRLPATLSSLALLVVLPVLGTALGSYLLYLLYSKPGAAALGLEAALPPTPEELEARPAGWETRFGGPGVGIVLVLVIGSFAALVGVVFLEIVLF